MFRICRNSADEHLLTALVNRRIESVNVADAIDETGDRRGKFLGDLRD